MNTPDQEYWDGFRLDDNAAWNAELKREISTEKARKYQFHFWEVQIINKYFTSFLEIVKFKKLSKPPTSLTYLSQSTLQICANWNLLKAFPIHPTSHF